MDHNSVDDRLVPALDAWFGVLRRRTGAPVPLVPAKKRDLDTLEGAWGQEPPPDVVALYEYSNGAWRDRKTPLDVFMPNWGQFRPISRHVYSMTWELAEEIPAGPGYDELPGRDFEKNIPIINFDTGDQLSIMTAPSVYQAVAYYSLDSAIYWKARRLSEWISYAVELENRGMLNWDAKGRPTIAVSGRPCPFDPDLEGYGGGWRWEPFGEGS